MLSIAENITLLSTNVKKSKKQKAS